MSQQTTNTLRMEEGADITSKSGVYRVEKILKRRNFGELVQCTKQETGQMFALKCVRSKHFNKYKQEATVLKYLGDLNSEETHLVKFFEVFCYQDWICFVFEKMDLTLMDYLRERQWEPLSISEIRVIAEQMLLALNALNQAGITHMDIKPENIMLTSSESQPLKVKLTGFRNAGRTSKLEELDPPQNIGYSAPEVILDGPLNQSVDMWSLGCTLATLFLGIPLFPSQCEYDYLRIIVKLLGQPDKASLDQGWRAEQFFTLTSSWNLKTPEDYVQTTGRLIEGSHPVYETLDSLDAFLHSEIQDPTEVEDKESFVDLLRKMLALNPEDRIRPAQALNHEFIIKSHFADIINVPSASVAPETAAGNQDSVQPVENDKNDSRLQGATNSEDTCFILEEGVFFRSSSNVYHVEKVLGSGAFGQVAKCKTEETGEIVAIKLINQVNEWAAANEADALKYVSQLDPDEANIIRCMEGFLFKDCFCLVFELLDISLYDVMEERGWTPMSLDHIRSITEQMLVTLSALQDIGVTHTDIKPDNIMIVDRYSEELRVKLIDFGLARQTSGLSELELIQANGYRAPEVHLGLPRDECVDIWGLGCSIAFLFLGRNLCPSNDYEALRIILKLLGQPDDYSLKTGVQVKRYFTQDQSGTERLWRLKTPEEFQQDTGQIVKKSHPAFDELESLDDLLTMAAEPQDPTAMEDLKLFVDLLKKMLALLPEDRISPDRALKHGFITKEHLANVRNVPSASVAPETAAGNQYSVPPLENGETDSNFQGAANSEDTRFILEEGVFFRSSSNVYRVEKVLGSGAFGQVAKCKTEETGEIVAIKIINQRNEWAAANEADALKYVSQLDPDEANIIRCMEGFLFKDCFCLVFELLDISLYDVMEERGWTPMSLDHIRSITEQMLVTLSALQDIGVTHTDIKPDNIMIVDRYSEELRVKLIDFGLARQTSSLSELELMQADAYRAPEVHLGLPRDECVDMWGLGCSIALLFLGRNLCPSNDYEALRIILKLLGQPDDYSLNTGVQVKHYFTQDQSGTDHSWRLKTPEEFQEDTGEIVEESHPIFDELESLDDLIKMAPAPQDPTAMDELKLFVDLLKKMLALLPEDRISPDRALKHGFITKEHLANVRNIPSASVAPETAAGNQYSVPPLENGETDSPTEGTGEIVAIELINNENEWAAANEVEFQETANESEDTSVSVAPETVHSGPSVLSAADHIGDEFSFNPQEETGQQTPATSFQQEISVDQLSEAASLSVEWNFLK